jgi:hypothetical protein
MRQALMILLVDFEKRRDEFVGSEFVLQLEHRRFS